MIVSGHVNKFYKLISSCFILLNLSLSCFGQTTPEAKKIDNYIKEKLQNSGLPGLAIAVVHHDDVILAKGYGKATNNDNVTANTSFPIASLSKAFTATAILQLAEKGKIDIDTPVIKYLPLFLPNDTRRNKITVRQILHQIGGLGDAGYPEFTIKNPPANLDAAITNLKSAKLVSEPGAAFHYHNPNYELLAKIVEVASGEKFAVYLQKHIFGPLNMYNTYDVATTDKFYNAPQSILNGNIYFLGRPVAYKEPGWFTDGDGGIVSNANNMASWLSFQLKGISGDSSTILGNRFIKLMQSPPQNTSFDYGMGWHVNNARHILYHGGIMWTYSAQEMLLTNDGYGVVILFNGGVDNLTDYYSFLSGVQEILNNKEPGTGAFPRWLYTAICIVIILAIITLGTRRLLRTKQWHQNYKSRAVWKTWLYMLLRIAPLVLLLLIPRLLTLISGRVLSWPGIILMFVDTTLILALIAVFNAAIAARRLVYLYKHR